MRQINNIFGATKQSLISQFKKHEKFYKKRAFNGVVIYYRV